MSIAIGLSVFDSSLYIPELRAKKRDSVLSELVSRAHRAGAVREPAVLLETLCLRERLGSTAAGKGVAVPNARSLTVRDPRLVLARSRRGIDWGAPDDLAVHLVLLVLSPAEASEDAHHEFLARALGATRLQRHRQKLIEAATFDAVASALRELTA